jgi:hypothetical protein
MAELDRFEARLAASLERLADEVPTYVDPLELTASIAAAEAGRGWLRPMTGLRGLRLSLALRLGLILVTVLALGLGMVVLSQRRVPAPFDAMTHGPMTCPGPAWTAEAAGSLVLECTSALPDPRLAGIVRITLDATTAAGDPIVRTGSIHLDGDGAGWAGFLEMMTAPSGMTSAEAVLAGTGAADGLVLQLHLVSTDGLEWGLLASVASDR